MELTQGNEHLVTSPEDYRIGDLVEFREINGTIVDITYYDKSCGKSAGKINRLFVLPIDGTEPISLMPLDVRVISRGEDITSVSDEDLEARIARLHTFNYSPVDPHRKRKAKGSSTRKVKGKDSITDKTRAAVKTGKLGMEGIEKINALLAQLQKGERS